MKNPARNQRFLAGFQAERQGFEPWMDLHPCRFSRPDPHRGNVIADKELQSTPPGCCTKCCTPPLNDQLPPELKNLVTAWATLPVHIRQAIMSLVAASVNDGKDSHG